VSTVLRTNRLGVAWERYLRWAAWVNCRRPSRRERERLHVDVAQYLADPNQAFRPPSG
jgi:hypothetical protein